MSRKTGIFSYGLVAAILFIAGIGFFFLSTFTLGFLPGKRLEKQIAANKPQAATGYTPAEKRGRHIYAREGCAYCHSEQVRHTPADVRRWGPPTLPWETSYDTPQLWGTRRIGPDLAREAGVRSTDWQLVHLYDPRYVVPKSIMPGYPWLFKGGPDKPTRDAKDLVAYLNTLGKPRRQAAGLGAGQADSPTTPEQRALDNNPSRPRAIASGTVTRTLSASGDVRHGKRLFAEHCSACHGDQGRADTPGAKALEPHPVDLSEYRYTQGALASILYNGVAGSAMPAWRDLGEQERADIVAYVQTLHDTPSHGATKPDDRTLARGAQLFATSCSSCHGVNGAGDGPAAHVYQPRPFNFQHIQPDTHRIMTALENGVPGSSMPAFPGFGHDDRQAVAAYVRSLYNGHATD